MKKLIFAFLVVLLGLGNCPIMAQTNDLSPEELEMFQEEVKRRTNRFQMYLTFIGNKENDLNTKQSYVKQTLKLFIGKGENYKDIYGNNQPAVGMETTSKTTGRKSWQTTKQYLDRLTKLPYNKLEITWVDTCRVSNFYKVKDELYQATVTVSQRFAGYRENVNYIDTTVKVIDVYLEEYLTVVGRRYRILFGDIEALETH